MNAAFFHVKRNIQFLPKYMYRPAYIILYKIACADNEDSDQIVRVHMLISLLGAHTIL